MSRITETLKYDWAFARGEIPHAKDFSCRYAAWQTVRVPHDYAIEGPFDPQNDKGNFKATADGFPASIDAAGRTGALPLAGTAWYRKTLFIQKAWENKRIFLEFDGIMSHAEIFMNGVQLHRNVYGYTSFSVDISDAVRFGEENLLAVRVSQNPWESRWYPGAGIYRNVRLVVKEAAHIAYNGVCITTKGNDVSVQVEIEKPEGAVLAVSLGDANTEVAAQSCTKLTLSMENPRLWSHKDPYLYTAELRLVKNGTVLDVQQVRVGFRDIVIDRERGLFVNGEYTKLKGVCMHHDMGAIGAATNISALRRQYKILSDMGCNAIRTSHNPPSPEVLDLADELGFYVIDEAFDQWREPKTTNGYSMYFAASAEYDLSAMLLRDRSHPCIIMWSIGNEMTDQWYPHGAETTRFLADICHRLDPTRPVTAGFDHVDDAWKNGLISGVDVVGLNYRPHIYDECFEKFGLPIYGSETASCVSSRGVYHIPRKQPLVYELEESKRGENDPVKRPYRYYDYVEIPAVSLPTTDVSSYDLTAPNWAYYPEVEFKVQDDRDWLLGEFVWTGFDYLGEPTPYGMYGSGGKLARSSFFGIVDLAGLPKDRFYSYQAKWTDKEVLHLFPHWNWEAGDVLPVCCYTSYDRAELFVNGVSMGIREKQPESANCLERYRLIWPDIAYAPGEIEVRALSEKGEVLATETVRTAGAPGALVLSSDREGYTADGDDLCYITVKIVDKDGNLCPKADNRLSFSVSGCGEFIASDNGCQTDLEVFSSDARDACNGYAVGIFRTLSGQSGDMKITVTAEGIGSAEITVTVA